MTVIAVTSSRTSPGATSLATGLALSLSIEHERALLVEADPAGGVLSLRFDLDVTPSLTTFGSDTRNGYDHELVWRNTQDLRGAHCLPAPVDPRLARSWVERVTPDLIEHLPSIGAPVVIDLGWISEDGPSLGLAEAADVTLVVTRPEMAEVQALLFQVRQLQNSGATVGLVTVGTAPNDPQEIAAVAGIPLVAVLPDDATLAAALRGAKFAPNKFRRSLLWRTIAGIATSLVNTDLVQQRAAAATDGPSSPAPRAPAPETHPGESASFGEPIPVGEFPDPPRPSFSDRYSADIPRVSIPSSRPAPAADVPTEPMDPELIDVTNKLGEQPDAELIMDTGERVRLDAAGATVIGRHSDCEIMIRDSQVSRRHGRLARTVTGWHYRDLGSRNGTVINGQPCTERFLESGDELYIGGARFIFQTISSHPTPSHRTPAAASAPTTGTGAVATLDKETA